MSFRCIAITWHFLIQILIIRDFANSQPISEFKINLLSRISNFNVKQLNTIKPIDSDSRTRTPFLIETMPVAGNRCNANFYRLLQYRLQILKNLHFFHNDNARPSGLNRQIVRYHNEIQIFTANYSEIRMKITEPQ